jgi:AcrR family transcriptional regulator
MTRGQLKMKVRARNIEDKQERRSVILDAGEALFQECAFSELTMSDVAERAGVAKGTVYLYFPTKEALFLDLLESRMLEWIDSIDQRLQSTRGEWNVERVVRLLVDSLNGRETLVRMLTMQGSILEHNIDVERTRDFKLRLCQRVSASAEHLSARLPMFTVAAAGRVILHIHALVVGLGQMAYPAAVTQQALEDPRLCLFRIDFRKEFTFALRAVFRGLESQED